MTGMSVVVMAVMGLMGSGLVAGEGGGASPVAGEQGGAEAVRLPDQSGDFFADLAEGLRPQWRQYFRERPEGAPRDRVGAALSMGALVADLSLACEARDAQQFRNLLVDLTALETMLGIGELMGSTRHMLTSLADGGEWKALRGEVGSLVRQHRRHLTAHRDQQMADLESIGQWVRTWQVAVQFCGNHEGVKVPPLGKPEWIDVLKGRAAPLAEAEVRPCVVIRRQLVALDRMWAAAAVDGEARKERMKQTREALNELMARSIDPVAKH